MTIYRKVVNSDTGEETLVEIVGEELAEMMARQPLVRPVPSITARQFFIIAAMAGIITSEEALAAAQTGAVPSAIESVFVSLPAEQELAARITWAKMTILERGDPLVVACGEFLNIAEEQLDNLFREAAQL